MLLQLGVRMQRSLLNTRRTVNKGATLIVDTSGTAFKLDIPDEVREAIRVFENRAWRTVNSLGWQGFFVPFAPLKGDNSFDFPLARIDWASLRSWDGTAPLIPSPMLITLDSLYLIFDGTLFFQGQIADKFDASVCITDFFAFLHAVWVPTVRRMHEGVAPFGWGYDFWSWRSFRNMLALEGPRSYASLFNLMWKYLGEDEAPVLESLTPQYWLRAYRNILAFTCYDCNHTSGINHRDLYPAKYLFVTEQGVFAHLGLYPHFLHSLWSDFEMTGNIGSQKGPAFEHWAFGFLQTEDFMPVWEPSRPFPFKVGRRAGTDIDLIFRKGTMGFVISCKSYANTRETYEGDRRAVWLRWTEIQSWVKENDELTAAMVQHAAEIQMPKDMRTLVPLVCVPQAEYLWDTSRHYMLTNDLPRVLTPWELKEWIGSISEDEVRELPYVHT